MKIYRKKTYNGDFFNSLSLFKYDDLKSEARFFTFMSFELHLIHWFSYFKLKLNQKFKKKFRK